MQKKIVAATMVALFALLGFVAVMVTDFHDRSWPQDLGAEAKVSLDFTHTSSDPAQATDVVASVGETYGLGLFKVAPDLDDTGREVFVALNGQPVRGVDWFGGQQASDVLGPERLANSSPDGTYYVQDASRLGEAVDGLQAQGVVVVRTDAAVLDTVRHLTAETGFVAPVLAGALLVAALTVFWLASRARSRALRVLGGGSPWRIQAQDVGGHLLLLLGCAALVAAVSCALVGVFRGWAYVPVFATSLLLFEAITLAISVVVIVVMSCLVWPSADLFATRRPAVVTLRGPARVVQAATLLALIACAGPAWAASQDAGRTARQLAAWNQFSDQVALTFAMDEKYFDQIAPQVQEVVSSAEADGQAALSYTINERAWEGDFGPYSAISIVNPGWAELVGATVGLDALVPAGSESVSGMLRRELGPSLAVWGGESRTGDTVLADLKAYAPKPGVQYPVADGGASGQLSFRDDVLVLEAPTIATVFDDRNTISLASTGNVVLTGVAPTQKRLDDAGLGDKDLAKLGVEGAVHPVYVAEQGILQAQYATYLARILALSVAALAVAFLVSAGVNAMVSALLNARLDFPMRLSGATWERTARPRALRDLLVGALLVVLALAFQLGSPAALAATAVTGVAGLAALYLSHGAAAATVFSRVTHRKL
ncbi:hypothetical protein ACF1FX_35865 [Streptomyces sp. NPDC014646]|uniref:hypothetical protein n=1 Tax=Streptomyces sp. NPDC014646 TaxID=3364877 RepID=UPI0036F5AB79